MGLPGQAGGIAVVNVFKDPDDPRNRGGPVGLPGRYKVVFTLSRPGFPLNPENRYSFESGLRGDSHLAIAKPAFEPPGNPDATQIEIRGTTEAGEFEFTGRPNKAGFLAKIEGEVEAQSFVDAQAKAHRALVPNLSTWSAHIDVPLHVYQIDVTELRTGNTNATFVNSLSEVPFAFVPSVKMGPAFRSLASLYREALESSTPVYRFLCLFKIIEGIRARRKRVDRETKKAGLAFSRPPEVVPENPEEFKPWLNAIFPIRPHWGWDEMALVDIFRTEVRGKNFETIWDEILVPVRNDVAHALFEDTGETTLYADDLLHRERVDGLVPITKCMARRMMKHEFPSEFLTYLKDDGTISA